MTVAMRKRRKFKVYRPFVEDLPNDLVGADAKLDDVRVAKLDGVVIGAYRLARVDTHRFEIKALAVYERHRGKGVGRWLLGHALGIVESRGGRVVYAPRHGFFHHAGFERVRADAELLRLCLSPE